MKKTDILEKIIIIILIIMTLIPLSQLAITSHVIFDTPTEYSYTTAICDKSNHCEDYIIKCDKNNLKGLTPTGQAIQKDQNWIDERENKGFCN